MKTAMIWGASGGIGRALLRQLDTSEWNTFAISRHPGDVADLARYTLEADSADPFAVQQAVMGVGMEVDAVDLWIYTAGDILSQPIADLEPGDWQRILEANLTGAYVSTHFSLPLLAAEAHLFYVGAISERLMLPGLSAYAAAKAGLEAFTATLAKEERQRRVTLVRPAAVDTDLWGKVPMRMPKQALSAAAVAIAVMEAYHAGHRGKLELH